MAWWRKILVFIIAVAMIVGGIFFLWGELLYLEHHSLRAGIVIGTVMLIGLGVYLLWEDIVSPMLGSKDLGGSVVPEALGRRHYMAPQTLRDDHFGRGERSADFRAVVKP
jgi:hypothetical protein